jgi:hypothetical protein
MPVCGAAQQARPVTLSLVAGPSVYDLSGTGTSFAGAALVAWEPIAGLVLEPGVTFFTYSSQFDTRFSYLFPELSIQGQLPRGRMRPFLGVGAGGAFVLSGSSETVATLHAVGGVRVRVNTDWAVRGELRVRAVRPWTGNTADFLFGVSRRLR